MDARRLRVFLIVLLTMTAAFVPALAASAAKPRAQCSDGIDNDADGAIDFPADSGCDSASDNLESNHANTQCADGVDNDNDGFIDFPNDPGCFSVLDNSEKTH